MKIQCITIDCSEPRALAKFWSEVLNWKVTYDSESEVVLELHDGGPAVGLIPDLLFIKNADIKSVKNRLHLDLRPANQEVEVKRLEALGAKQIEIGQSEDHETTWIVMADPEGNEFCVLKAL
jgi:predicted enzyme related to lactoylglutathione lyase